MRNYQTLILPPDFLFLRRNFPAKLKLSDVVLNEIETVWQKEMTRRKGVLYNGRMLSLVEVDQKQLIAEFIEYKIFLAYLHHPHLRKILGIKPLALSCMTFTEKSALIGRRSKLVKQYPLWYEFVPSGGIDERAVSGEVIDISGQARSELFEETGYSSAAVDRITPYALVRDRHTGIYEVCVKIAIYGGEDVKTLAPTAEYDRLEWVPKSVLASFVENHRLVPFSQYLLQLM